jgi:hypothetical protein
VVDRDTEHDYIIQHMCFACCYIRPCTKQVKIYSFLSTSKVFTRRYDFFIAVRTLPLSFALVFANGAVDLH